MVPLDLPALQELELRVTVGSETWVCRCKSKRGNRRDLSTDSTHVESQDVSDGSASLRATRDIMSLFFCPSGHLSRNVSLHNTQSSLCRSLCWLFYIKPISRWSHWERWVLPTLASLLASGSRSQDRPFKDGLGVIKVQLSLDTAKFLQFLSRRVSPFLHRTDW